LIYEHGYFLQHFSICFQASATQMEGFQHAGTGKNKKVVENSPCLHFSLKGPKSENFKKSYLLSDMANFDYYFCFE
jgi:hypothetical protein